MIDFYQVRAHHLLCARQFRGHGYSPGFVRRVKRTLRLWQSRDKPIVLISHHDPWCWACPLKDTPDCRWAFHRDALTLDFLGLPPGSRLPWSQAQYLVEARLDREKILAICSGCPWLEEGYCRW
ncbi:MAG TPA: DUF1284 domain-containing protein [Moorella mulderi]|nr:DUF1284 domain-containing protein [Moorella mulderi]